MITGSGAFHGDLSAADSQMSGFGQHLGDHLFRHIDKSGLIRDVDSADAVAWNGGMMGQGADDVAGT